MRVATKSLFRGLTRIPKMNVPVKIQKMAIRNSLPGLFRMLRRRTAEREAEKKKKKKRR